MHAHNLAHDVRTSGGSGSTEPLPATPTSKSTAEGRMHDIIQTASAAPQFKTLTSALTAADLTETLSGKGPFTGP